MKYSSKQKHNLRKRAKVRQALRKKRKSGK
jgi:hypothetical protein